MDNIVVTIARQYGSGGKTIGQMFAEKNGMPWYDMDLAKMASEESGIKEEPVSYTHLTLPTIA